MNPNDMINSRRGFLGGLAAGAAALAVTPWSSAHAEGADGPPAVDDAWAAKITGKHRQVFDAVNPAHGWGPAFALNYLETTEDLDHLTDKDLSAVVVMRHFAMPLLLKDAVWKKYKIGAIIDVTDPKTDAPATRNPYYDNIPLRPGLTYEKMISERGVIMVGCNLALKVVAGMAAEKVGLSKEEAVTDFQNGLFKGVFLAPSGVFAVNRAQEAGCTYCYAG
jgi:hypothetical protein